MSRPKQALLFVAVLLAVCATYGNHFHNGFHFDDSHAVVDNPSIRSLGNLPRFFTDAATFSVLPANRTYRPFVSASLAVDYALGHGYNAFWFQLSTFVVFLLQLLAMYAFFTAILNAARPPTDSGSANGIAALIAVAWYGLHPAMAETVNYVIQRGDVFCAFGVVAALAVFVQWPRLRWTGVYLLPFAFALLSKPPAAVFPLLLFLYIALFEGEGKPRYRQALIGSLPSVAVTVLLMGLQAAMTPKSYTPSTLSAWSYRITQPYVLLRYFNSLFLPFHLNVDTDLQAFDSFTFAAFLGFLFIAVLLAVAWFAARRRALRPVSYGVLWFLIASLPTSLYRLSEVENDHRMYLPFIGLILAVVWAGFLAVEKLACGAQRALVFRTATVAAVLLLSAYAYGAHLRNQVWRTDESLWLDDIQKSPHNGRGLMNYGLTQMAKGAYPVALDSFQRALEFTPNYPSLEINLGIVEGALNHPPEAEQHFLRAIGLSPADDETHFFYGRWLYQTGRIQDALAQLKSAVQLNPSRLPAHELLAQAYSAIGDQDAARAAANETLLLEPADATALAVLAHPAAQDANYWINASLYQYKSGNYEACIASAREALKVKPDSELAYNNIGAAYAGLQQWDLAIENEREALRIKPGFQLAQNNIALYAKQVELSAGRGLANSTPEEWLNASLRAYQAGRYALSIKNAQEALRLRPGFAEAYNNLAANYEAMGQWDQAIAAAQTAVRLKPDFQLAKNNLAWAQSQKRLQAK